MNLQADPNASLELAELRQRALAVPHDPVHWPIMSRLGIEVLVRRDDLVHEAMPGNKFYKLFHNLSAARRGGYTQLVSFGGAYSNHLHALAAAGRTYGFTTHGLVRGERPKSLSPTLQDAESFGMNLHFIPRQQYRQSESVLEPLQDRYSALFAIPEGGANDLGCQGTREMGRALDETLQGAYDTVCLPSGTGSTLAGVASGLPSGKIALGFSVLKGEGSLGAEVRRSSDSSNWRLISGFHGGGYGRKLKPNLQNFWHRFEHDSGLLADPVYTLKMFWGIEQLALRGYWPRGSRLVAIHTGGLQGRRGFLDQAPVWAPDAMAPNNKKQRCVAN
ncbi:1-aminocyclopropane-1-carboxylate deaminase/D-cysteine desulfhydrase [Marinimicrobium sp. ABcell2]|uniref:1-aminocyclopropane-1-carboxylate deaminase/D-cysteine desulfhydrase n=1 Tax=Marinimicrobium sp. ABcell2 TaxID=3069751 RepID=UPI0027B6DFFB|nr:pyridoxal-phosphate dependent enzyme [Marinimicrobium sp. ABcell2]MDQ2078014.1 pyridoxal-phosphate dependent enzyme [Marinimicrobium sp. ABcell2]